MTMIVMAILRKRVVKGLLKFVNGNYFGLNGEKNGTTASKKIKTQIRIFKRKSRH